MAHRDRAPESKWQRVASGSYRRARGGRVIYVTRNEIGKWDASEAKYYWGGAENGWVIGQEYAICGNQHKLRDLQERLDDYDLEFDYWRPREAQTPRTQASWDSVYDEPDEDDPISRAIEYCRDHEDDEAATAVEAAVAADLTVIAVKRNEVCATCTGINGAGAAYCPISLEMAEQFGGGVDDSFCPFWDNERGLDEPEDDRY